MFAICLHIFSNIRRQTCSECRKLTEHQDLQSHIHDSTTAGIREGYARGEEEEEATAAARVEEETRMLHKVAQEQCEKLSDHLWDLCWSDFKHVAAMNKVPLAARGRTRADVVADLLAIPPRGEPIKLPPHSEATVRELTHEAARHLLPPPCILAGALPLLADVDVAQGGAATAKDISAAAADDIGSGSGGVNDGGAGGGARASYISNLPLTAPGWPEQPQPPLLPGRALPRAMHSGEEGSTLAISSRRLLSPPPSMPLSSQQQHQQRPPSHMSVPPLHLSAPRTLPSYADMPATIEEAAAFVSGLTDERAEHVPGGVKAVLLFELPHEMLELVCGEEALARKITEDLMIAAKLDASRISVDKIFASKPLAAGATGGGAPGRIGMGAVVCVRGAPGWKDDGIKAADARYVLQDLCGQSLDPYSALYAGSVTRHLTSISLPSNSRDSSPLHRNKAEEAPTPRYPPSTLTHVPAVPSSILKRAHAESSNRRQPEVSEEELADLIQVRSRGAGGGEGESAREEGGNMRKVFEEYLQQADLYPSFPPNRSEAPLPPPPGFEPLRPGQAVDASSTRAQHMQEPSSPLEQIAREMREERENEIALQLAPASPLKRIRENSVLSDSPVSLGSLTSASPPATRATPPSPGEDLLVPLASGVSPSTALDRLRLTV